MSCFREQIDETVQVAIEAILAEGLDGVVDDDIEDASMYIWAHEFQVMVTAWYTSYDVWLHEYGTPHPSLGGPEVFMIPWEPEVEWWNNSPRTDNWDADWEPLDMPEDWPTWNPECHEDDEDEDDEDA